MKEGQYDMDIFAFVSMVIFVICFLYALKSLKEKSKYFGVLAFTAAIFAGINFWLLYYFIGN